MVTVGKVNELDGKRRIWDKIFYYELLDLNLCHDEMACLSSSSRYY